MARRSDRLTVTLVALALVATLGAFARPPVVAAGTTPFTDIAGTTFEADIEWLFAEGVTRGCTATTYCPDDPVTRGQMASFLVRMFDLPATDIDHFTDDNGTTHEIEINKLAASGITVGCTETKFCPKANVRRDEMASFLVRAIPLTAGAGNNYFRDDDGTTHEANIDRAAAAGITTGCGTWRYCIAASVTRGQMAGFLHRVVTPVTPPPHPAPGISTLYVATTGTDAANPCLTEATPCRTIRYALLMAFDGDTIDIGPGTYAEEDLVLTHDVVITGDPGGGTKIDASGGGRYRVMTIPAGHTVSLQHLTLTGGRADTGGAIYNDGVLGITSSTISGNTAAGDGGGVYNGGFGVLTVTGSRLTDNGASRGGAVLSFGEVSLRDSTISANAASTNGGGVWGAGKVVVTNSAIDGNGASGAGGGMSQQSGTLTLASSTISRNTAAWGGGAISNSATVILADSTLDGNSAAWGGGGISQTSGALTVVNSTIVGNSSEEWGGGIEGEGGTLLVVSTTISQNTSVSGGGISVWSSAIAHLENSLVVGNAAPIGPDSNGGTEVTKLASIVGIPAGLTLADILDAAGLADNGGPTQTIALTDSAKNPAIDKGDAATCAAAPVSGLDQRGLPRTPPCDIGAFELQP